MERAKGIEPSYAAWEAAVLPLNYARSVNSPCISAHDADGRRRFGTRISAKLNSRLRGRDLLPGTRYSNSHFGGERDFEGECDLLNRGAFRQCAGRGESDSSSVWERSRT